ncbi:sugar-binding protein [bacterium M00.F.Ca.ET.228.01.1.1]|uniref:RHS repeat domain-containing protein n=2 Tax=Pseudomonadota TaxID=1224 RepID=UPI0010922B98|nr:RHS repeat domain-containing protein [Paraburkholderia phenoliruptrix]TGP47888.1 sugar-binding protein [bacterium M00.F.Ca.ET.228.01.1.1]TGS05681.1 sugar-binding protein [bacterium M00.F.Ca.ET.191.01.1.1]TGU10617.1 sugar-binding protein [bacterium M00.F.Ca.ET.155.01.1.1]MBW0445306.1 sugar-binding protein [Paraburkholderia phenoliruptrix]MBW9096071.1 sugar-binding protein [Paraburkholderia phenoliruptrix]
MANISGGRGARFYASAKRGLECVRRTASAGAVAYIAILPMAASADDITYAYDPIGRLTSVSVAGSTAYYDYDAAGNISAIRTQMAVSSSSSDAAGSSALASQEVSSSPVASAQIVR